jgi:AraC-like DNA-binding protein
MRFRKVVRQIAFEELAHNGLTRDGYVRRVPSSFGAAGGGLCASNQPVHWVDVALEGGFSDQSHFVNEFRAFSGFSPERYLAAEHPFPNHVRID